MSELVAKIRAAIDDGDWGPICGDDGTWTSSPSKLFAEAHRAIIQEYERCAIPADEHSADYVAGYFDALESVLDVLAKAYDVTVE